MCLLAPGTRFCTESLHGACHLQVQEHVDDAVKKGGKVTIGGKRPDLPEPYNKVCHNAFMHVS